MAEREEQVLTREMRLPVKLNRIEERKIEEFILRHKNRPLPMDNASLVAGSPMYYYCKACGKFITALPEEHIRPAPKYCDDCQDLKNEALLDEALRRINA
jgi:hypothetical protein